MCSNHFDLKFRSTSWYHSSHKIFRVLSPYQIVFSRKVKKNKIQNHWLTSKIWIVEIFLVTIFLKRCVEDFVLTTNYLYPNFLHGYDDGKRKFFLMPKKKKKISKQSLCSVRFFLNLGSSSKYFSFLFYCFLSFLSFFLSFFLFFFFLTQVTNPHWWNKRWWKTKHFYGYGITSNQSIISIVWKLWTHGDIQDSILLNKFLHVTYSIVFVW